MTGSMDGFAMRVAAIAGACVTMAACGGGSGCEMGAMADTTGWQLVDAGPFVFKVPPGYHDEMPRGIDSYIGRWTRGERVISFDWGQWTSDPRERRDQPVPPRICKARIGRHKALVMDMRRTEAGREWYIVRAWWRGKETPPESAAHLSLGGYGPVADTAGRAQALTVIRTVRLRTRWSAQDRLRFRHRTCERMRADLARTAEPYPPDVASLRDCPPGPPPPPPDYESVR